MTTKVGLKMGGPRKGSKKQPPARGGGGGKEVLGSPGDSDAENADWSQQTEQEKRKVIEFNSVYHCWRDYWNFEFVSVFLRSCTFSER